MEIAKSTGLSIFILMLSFLINASNASDLTINNDPLSLFVLQYDLVLLGFSILAGSYFTIDTNSKEAKKLFLPMAMTFIILILCYAFSNIANANWAWMSSAKDLFRIWLPLILGLFSVGFSIHFVRI